MLAVLAQLFADGTDAAAQRGAGMDTFMFLVAPILLFIVFIFLPMRRDTRMRRQMLSQLKKGDRVLINGFLIGKVLQIEKGAAGEEELQLKVDDNANIKLRVLRGSVTRILKSEETKEGN